MRSINLVVCNVIVALLLPRDLTRASPTGACTVSGSRSCRSDLISESQTGGPRELFQTDTALKSPDNVACPHGTQLGFLGYGQSPLHLGVLRALHLEV